MEHLTFAGSRRELLLANEIAFAVGGSAMDEDRAEGTVRNIGGKVQEGLGRATGDLGTQAKGQLNQAAGAAQDLYGQVKDSTRETATSLDQWLRHAIETQPYTTAIAALGIGWLLGRLHRPL
jgi:uncharacterized protein YjbJ (UPF0337 family)